MTVSVSTSAAVGAGVCAGGFTVMAAGNPTSMFGAVAAVCAVGFALGAVWMLRQRSDPPPSPETSSQSDERARLELLGGLAAGLAHELGQPLSVARVGIEGVHYLRQLGREPSPDHLFRTLSRVGLSLMAMTQTIEHLRSLAYPEQGVGPLVKIDLVAAVDRLLAEREQWMRYADTHIEWRRPQHETFALVDAAGLHLILTNLLRNAVEAVASQSEARRLVRVSVGPGPMVTVHDGGSGIPAEQLARIFDPFRSTKGHGRGIGLSLAKASAERMGARLEVASTVGSGTIFSLTVMTPSVETVAGLS